MAYPCMDLAMGTCTRSTALLRMPVRVYVSTHADMSVFTLGPLRLFML